jgi:ribonuclease D
VIHLAAVYRQLAAQLDARKLAWLLEDGAEQVANLRREVDPELLYRESKLGWKLSRQQLAVLRALYAWRERQARERDQARNRVIREHSLWPLARTQPDNLADLAKIEDMHPRTVRQDGESILQVIRAAAQTPVADWPEALAEPLPVDAAKLLKKLRAVGQAEAEKQGMVVELMLRKKHLEQLLKTGYPDGPYSLPEGLRGWRRELMGAALLAALTGDAA